jgi:hypothetical protein
MPPPGERSLGTLFSDALLARLRSTALWGAVFPPRPPPPAPFEDARQYALEALADYVAEIVFTEPGGKTLRIVRDRIFAEQPDDANTAQLMPSVEFLPGTAEHNFPGLTPAADEASFEVFGPGTVLVPQYEHVERFQIEVRATTRAQRHMLLAGIEQALQPSEDYGELRLLTDYYGQPARFTTIEGQVVDDESMTGLRRRRAVLTCSMGIDVVKLVRVVPIRSVRAEVAVVPSGLPLP